MYSDNIVNYTKQDLEKLKLDGKLKNYTSADLERIVYGIALKYTREKNETLYRSVISQFSYSDIHHIMDDYVWDIMCHSEEYEQLYREATKDNKEAEPIEKVKKDKYKEFKKEVKDECIRRANASKNKTQQINK